MHPRLLGSSKTIKRLCMDGIVWRNANIQRKQKASTNLIDRDRQLIWHPFSQAKTDDPPIPIGSGKGKFIK